MLTFDKFISDMDLEKLNQQNYERLFKFMTFLMLHKKDSKIVRNKLRLRNVPVSIFHEFINTDFTIQYRLGSWNLLHEVSYRELKYGFHGDFSYIDLDIDLQTTNSCISLRKFNDFYDHSKYMYKEFFIKK